MRKRAVLLGRRRGGEHCYVALAITTIGIIGAVLAPSQQK
jgi:hypothetical protein